MKVTKSQPIIAARNEGYKCASTEETAKLDRFIELTPPRTIVPCNYAARYILSSAVQSRDTNLVGYLLARGAQADDGRAFYHSEPSPLLVAVGIRSLEMAEILLQAGARVDTQTPNGTQESAIFRAYYRAARAAVKSLMEGGANLDLRDCGRKTVYQRSFMWKKPEISKLLTNQEA